MQRKFLATMRVASFAALPALSLVLSTGTHFARSTCSSSMVLSPAAR